MEIYKATLTFLAKEGSEERKDEEKSIQYLHLSREDILIGGDPTNNVRITDAEDTLCRIYVNSSLKVAIESMPTSQIPLLVNGNAIEKKGLLRSGDVITVLGSKMRWETHSDLKRRTAHLTKSARKELRHKYLKTSKRITIHNYTSLSNEPSSSSSSSPIDESTDSKEEAPEKSLKIEEVSVVNTTAAESAVDAAEQDLLEPSKAVTPPPAAAAAEVKAEQDSPPTLNKENVVVKTPTKLACNLNLSGTLQTSYTPQSRARTRSVAKTPSYATPLRSSAVKRDILKESPLKSNPKTPQSTPRRSMFLVDLVTPNVQKAASSTPRPLPVQKTPKTASKTAGGENRLLKSAIKNSALKKNPQVLAVKTPASKGKNLFSSSSQESPAKYSESSSVMSVSMSSSSIGDEVEIIDSSVTENSIITVRDTVSGISSALSPQNDQSTPGPSNDDDEMKNLIKSIDNVLEKDTTDNARNDSPVSIALESDEMSTVEDKFNKIMDDARTSGTSPNLFSQDIEMSSLDLKFEAIAAEACGIDTKMHSADEESDVKKKGEDVMKWIESAKEAIQTEPSKMTQVLSSRYSNVTPNDSIVDTVAANASVNYDALTPKISILGTVNSLRKSDFDAELVKSPVTRLSIGNNSTDVFENFNVNSNIHKSLRSTRKRFRSAIASVHDTSSAADTTVDFNESLNASLPQEGNQSQAEPSDILSLDDQPAQQPPAPEEENICLELSPSMNYLEFAVHSDDADQGTRKVFEIIDKVESSDHHQDVSDDEESESSSEEEEEEEVEVDDENDQERGEEEGLIDEAMGDDISNSNGTAAAEENSMAENNTRIQFRLSKEDLEEEGITPLDTSRNDEDDNQKQPEHIEFPETQQFDDGNDDEREGDGENSQATIQLCNDSVPVETRAEESEQKAPEEESPEQDVEGDPVAESAIEPESPLHSNEAARDGNDDETMRASMLWRNAVRPQDSDSSESMSTDDRLQPSSQDSDDPQVATANGTSVNDAVVKSQDSGDTVIVSQESTIQGSESEDGVSQKSLEELSSHVNNTINELIATPSDDLAKMAAEPELTVPDEVMNDDDIVLCAATQAFDESNRIANEKEYEELPATPEPAAEKRAEQEFDSAIAPQQMTLNVSATKAGEEFEKTDDADNTTCNETLDETKEEKHAGLSLSDSKNGAVDETFNETAGAGENDENDGDEVFGEIPINKSIEEEHLENSSFFKEESQNSQVNPRESDGLFSETEFSRVEVSGVLKGLNSDEESPLAKGAHYSLNETQECGVINNSVKEQEETADDSLMQKTLDKVEYTEKSSLLSFTVSEQEVLMAIEKANAEPKQPMTIDDWNEFVNDTPTNDLNSIENDLPSANVVQSADDSQSKVEEPQQPTFEEDKEDNAEPVCEPVVEEPCVKKFAYVTTEKELDKPTAPETPSRRRIPRVNYSELATGSPARVRKARSVSVESVKEEKQPEPQSTSKMETIVEDEVSMKISVQVTANDENDAVSTECAEPNEEAREEQNEEHNVPDDLMVDEITPGPTEASVVINEIPIETIDLDSDESDNQEASSSEEKREVDEGAPKDDPESEVIQPESEPESKTGEEVVDEQQAETTEQPEAAVENRSPVKSVKSDELHPPLSTINTPSKRRVARVNYTELATGSPARARRGRSASVDDAPKVVTTQTAKMLTINENETLENVSSAAAKEKTPEKVKIHNEPEVAAAVSEISDKKSETKTASPPKASASKPKVARSRKVDEIAASGASASETPSRRTRRGATPLVGTPIINSETPAKRRGRRVLVEETAPQADVVTISLQEDSAEPKMMSESQANGNKEEKAPAKKGRGRKAEAVEKQAEEDTVAEESGASQAEAHQVVEEEAVPQKRGKRGAVGTTLEQPKAATVATAAATKKGGRGRRGKAEEEAEAPAPAVELNEQQADEPEKNPSPKKSRKRAAEKNTEQPEAPAAATKKARGRRGQTEESEQTTAPASTVSSEETPDEPPVKKGRARGKAKEAEIPAASSSSAKSEDEKLQAKSRKARGKAEETVASSKEQGVASEEMPTKKGRTRKHKMEEEQTMEERVESGETSPKRSRRGVSKEKVEVPEEAPAPKRGRGKKAAAASQQPVAVETAPEVEKPVQKRVRGKKVEEVVVPTPEEEEAPAESVEASKPPPKAKRGRGAKAKEAESEQPQPAAPTASPKRGGRSTRLASKDSESAKEEPAPKKTTTRGRGKKDQPPTIEEKKPATEEVAAGRKARGKTPLEKVTKHVTIVTPSQAEKYKEKTQASAAASTVSEEDKPKRATKRNAQPAAVEEKEAPPTKRPTRSRK